MYVARLVQSHSEDRTAVTAQREGWKEEAASQRRKRVLTCESNARKKEEEEDKKSDSVEQVGCVVSVDEVGGIEFAKSIGGSCWTLKMLYISPTLAILNLRWPGFRHVSAEQLLREFYLLPHISFNFTVSKQVRQSNS